MVWEEGSFFKSKVFIDLLEGLFDHFPNIIIRLYVWVSRNPYFGGNFSRNGFKSKH